MLLNHSPKLSCVWRPYRLPFEQYCCRASEQGRIYDIRMTHHPANIRCSEEYISWSFDIKNIFDRQVQANSMPGCFSEHAFRQACRPTRIDNVYPICAL